ncbi:glycosyltransferase family 2 protein [Acidocella sp.]|uniref:glycosyltransferase family 2 protein n=1 Tax=Acidocella sp. TaxID=50710 RepID=UPI00262DFCE8|nr:glycosyltransferase family 2 protein [Acidocella sp.]
MTRIVSFTRVLNEDDIIEAFVRHNAAHVDEMLFLDNGSTDRTQEILRALREEGFPLKLFRNHAVSFDEVAINSWGYQMVSQVMAADWVAFLDADEFIATPGSQPLPSLLPAGARAIRLPLVNYGQVGGEDPAEPVVPWRLRWRFAGETGVDKVMARAKIPHLIVGAGNHEVFEAGREVPAETIAGLSLAHYPRRDAWQAMQKWVAGRMKALAAGGQGEYYSGHYVSPFETLRDKPGELLLNPGFFEREFDKSFAVEAPLAYLGGPLAYYQPADPRLKAATSLLHALENLARQHGRLLDELPEARTLTERWNARRDFLF